MKVQSGTSMKIDHDNRVSRLAVLEKRLPMVSIIIPAFNEEESIFECLTSLVEQSYPQELMEILVIDGMSQDRTLEIVNQFSKFQFNIRIYENKRKIIPCALNIGIKNARGEIILRADAHTLYDINYVMRSVDLLCKEKVGNVGGVIQPIGKGLVGKAIALGVSSPFGVGNAYYRFATCQKYVDTVAFGCWKRETLISLGGYNENYLVNEDYELNYRLRMNGQKILLSPDLKCYYFPRSSITSLVKQYYRYGNWKIKMILENPGSLVLRQVIPPLFALTLFLATAVAPFNCLPLILVLSVYAFANSVFSVSIAVKKKLPSCFILPIVFFSIHLAWGTGFLTGLRHLFEKPSARLQTA